MKIKEREKKDKAQDVLGTAQFEWLGGDQVVAAPFTTFISVLFDSDSKSD